MLRVMRSGASALLIAGLVAACASIAFAAPPQAGAKCEKKDEVRFSVGTGSVTIANAPLFSVPRYMGYWDEGCVAVTGYAGKTSLSMMQLLATGQLDVAFAGPNALLQARTQGVDAISVYQVGYKNYFWLAVPPDSPIKTIAALKGKTVGVNSMGDQILYLYRAMFKDAGLDPSKDVKFLAVGTGAPAMQAFKDGDIQAFGFWVDIYSAFKNQGYQFRYVHSPMESVADWSTNLYVTRKFADERPEVLTKFLKGISQAIIASRANPQATVLMHWKYFPDTKPSGVSDAEALKRGVRILADKLEIMGPVKGLKLGEQSVPQVAAYVKFAHEYGIIKTPMEANTVMTNKFIDAANTFDPKAVEQTSKNVKVP